MVLFLSLLGSSHIVQVRVNGIANFLWCMPCYNARCKPAMSRSSMSSRRVVDPRTVIIDFERLVELTLHVVFGIRFKFGFVSTA